MSLDFRRGASAAPAAGSGGGGNFAKVHYFGLQNNEKRIIRFLTDYEPENGVGGLLLLKQHFNVPTLPKPSDYTGDKWPDRLAAVCREDQTLAPYFPAGCVICRDIVPVHDDVRKAQDRFWALAVLRKEEWDEKGRLVGVSDNYRTVSRRNEKGDEEETQELDIVVLNFGMRNFFSRLSGFYSLYNTLLDRDYQVTRTGEQLKTEYNFAPLNPIQLDDGRILDLRENDLMANYLPRAEEVGYAAASDEFLAPIIEQQYDDGFYGRFFDPELRGAVPVTSAPVPEVATKPTAEESARLAQIKERLAPRSPQQAPAVLSDIRR